LIFPVAGHPQADVATATLKGTVSDESKAVLPGALITAKDLERGLVKEARTDAVGAYQIPLLPPGVYEIRISAPGFVTRTITQLELTVGQVAVINATLHVGAVSQEVIVTEELPLIEVERTQQANTIQQRQIANLPNVGRDFTSYVFTLPGVSSSNIPRPQNPGFTFGSSGFSIGGSNGRNNLVTMDGGENEYGSGQLRVATLSPEAVQEFQVNRNAFNAEFGQTVGTAVNVVTKSGTNELHGGVYLFYRSQRTSARNFFDRSAVRPKDQQMYPGVTLGGPLVKNRLFFFTSYENFRSDAARFRQYSNTALLNNTALISYLNNVPAPLGPRLIAQLNHPNVLKLLRDNEGNFNARGRIHTWSSRIDYQINDRNLLSSRFSLADGDTIGIGTSNAVAPSAATELFTRDYTWVTTWARNIRPNVINQARVQLVPNNSARTVPRAPGSTALTISGLATFGRLFSSPFNTFQDRYQFEDTLSWIKGSHTFKFGASYRPVNYRVINELWFGGLWIFSTGTTLASGLTAAERAVLPPGAPTLNSLQAFALGIPSQWRQGFNNAEWTDWTHFLGLFAQDSWKVARRLTIDYGVRFDYDREPTPLGTYANVAPRLGLAFDPWGDQKTVIRAGAGLFYSPVYYQVSYLTNLLNDSGKYINQVLRTAASGAPALWQAGVAANKLPFGSLKDADVTAQGISTARGAAGRVIFDAGPNYENPYSFQASFGISRRLFADLSLDVAYQMYRTVHIQMDQEVNFRESGAEAGFGLGPRLVAIDPTIAQKNFYSSIGNSVYHGMTVSLNKRYSRHALFQVNYTYSKAIDDNVDFNSAFAPFLPTRINLDRAPSIYDVRHNFVASGVFTSPWKAGAGHNPLARAFADLSLSPVITMRTGVPFTILMGRDTNGDNHAENDRPFYAPRNSGRDPNIYTVDLRLTKQFYILREKGLRVEFTVEASNILNHTNFLALNNSLAAVPTGTDLTPFLLGPFNLRGDRSRLPTSFLGFTAAGEPRRVQFGLKIAF
jgi:hypothetical protein